MNVSRRELRFGPYMFVAEGPDAGEHPFMIAGRRMYLLGHASSEPAPIGVEHIVGAMGGVWAHPIRVAGEVVITLCAADGTALGVGEASFSERLNEVAWSWSCGNLRVERRELILADEPGYAIELQLHNSGATLQSGLVRVEPALSFLGCWFGGLAAGGGRYSVAEGLISGQDSAFEEWGVAFGADSAPTTATPEALIYSFSLAPDARRGWRLLLVATHTGGAAGATAAWQRLWPAAARALEQPADLLDGLPRLICTDNDLARDFALAQANLRLLHAHYPALGDYLLAGLPEYPQLFGCDTAYSVPGACAAGFAAVAGSAIATLAGYAAAACGRVPHEITTNGRIFHPGNIQEIPQLTIALRDYLRWTGDLALAAQLYPVCHEGVIDLLEAHCIQGRPYPIGDGMIERLGMGSRKLDVTCYRYAGLLALADIAELLARAEAGKLRAEAARLREQFEHDWWMEAEGLYADSMHTDGRLQLDGHWTVLLPVQLGLAAPERARRLLDTLERDFVNEWGLVHTRGREELVWTLPTGLLALVAFSHGRIELGLRMLRNIALTTQHGTLGTFKELIPAGLCFVQLWSATIFVQALVEGLLGITPDASRHCLRVEPRIPAGIAPVVLEKLLIGTHSLDLAFAPGLLRIVHSAGPYPLMVSSGEQQFEIAPGAMADLTTR